MKIITDTREQLPYWTMDRRTLIVGDYTTPALLGRFHIERKSLQDLYGTLTKGNGRFKAELFRAAYHQIKIEVFVEGTHDDFINKRFPKGDERKFHTDGLKRLIGTFERKYYLKFRWHKSRRACMAAVEKKLKAEEKSCRA